MTKVFKPLMSFIWVCALMTWTTQAHAVISVTPNNDAETLVNLIIGSGITTSNETYTGAAAASGSFSDGLSSGIGIDNGLILTSGNASSAPGPNNSDSLSVNNGAGGDADLNAIVSPNSTFNASVLEFDFESAGGDLFFQYVFASEEYNEFTNTSFNDAFAFLLDGTNIALIPGTATPVTINTVNGGNPLGTNASHPEFYNNNDINDGGPFFNIQYDGFTDVFTASALNLAPGTHHIKLAIADTSDSSWDSAVFIKGGSFSDQPDPDTGVIPEPSTMLLFSFGAIGAAIRKKFC